MTVIRAAGEGYLDEHLRATSDLLQAKRYSSALEAIRVVRSINEQASLFPDLGRSGGLISVDVIEITTINSIVP